jgi:predicted enzyme related to lactoylglutathione lyase
MPLTWEELQKYAADGQPEGRRAPEMPPVPAEPAWLTTEPDQNAASIVWRTSMIKFRCTDQPKMVKWYRNVLGFKLDYDIAIKAPPAPFRMAVLVAPDNTRIEITGRGRPHKRPEDTWDIPIGLTFQVKDIQAAREHCIKMGVEYFEPEIQGQYGILMTLIDPENNLINLQAPNLRAWNEHGLDNPHVAKYNPNPRYIPD